APAPTPERLAAVVVSTTVVVYGRRGVSAPPRAIVSRLRAAPRRGREDVEVVRGLVGVRAACSLSNRRARVTHRSDRARAFEGGCRSVADHVQDIARRTMRRATAAERRRYDSECHLARSDTKNEVAVYVDAGEGRGAAAALVHPYEEI